MRQSSQSTSSAVIITTHDSHPISPLGRRNTLSCRPNGVWHMGQYMGLLSSQQPMQPVHSLPPSTHVNAISASLPLFLLCAQNITPFPISSTTSILIYSHFPTPQWPLPLLEAQKCLVIRPIFCCQPRTLTFRHKKPPRLEGDI